MGETLFTASGVARPSCNLRDLNSCFSVGSKIDAGAWGSPAICPDGGNHCFNDDIGIPDKNRFLGTSHRSMAGLGTGAAGCHLDQAARPPSNGKATPVTNAAPGEQR